MGIGEKMPTRKADGRVFLEKVIKKVL